jgi:hypothetical protein
MSSYKHFIVAALSIGAISVSSPAALQCAPVPDSVILNQGGKLFSPFSFNHAKHIEQIKECADCHHHTTGTLVLDPNCSRCHANSSPTAVVSCKGCHLSTPFSPETLAAKRADKQRYHLDKMGLKGAMHQSCIGCHSKKGNGPTGCQDCHPRTKEGEAFYSSARKGAKPAHAEE